MEADKVAGIQAVVDLEHTGTEEGEVLEVREVREAQEDDDLFVDEIVAAVQAEGEGEEVVRELDVEDAIVELAVEEHETEVHETEEAEAVVVVAVEDVYLELVALTYLWEEHSDFHLGD